MIDVIPTCVARDESDLVSAIERVRVFSAHIHVDVDDGLFAPHLSWPYEAEGVYAPFDLSAMAGLSADVHLMVEEPREIGAAFARAGAARVVGHLEAFEHADEARAALEAWRESGAQSVGLALLLHTPLEALEPVAADCDVLHLMSIATIGTQGIPYAPVSSARVAQCRALFPDAAIAVDGGVSETNIADLVRAGATRLYIGSAIMRSADPSAAYTRLCDIAASAR